MRGSRECEYSVYILASRSRSLYTGLTNNLRQRVLQHRHRLVRAFTGRYRIHRLVHIEKFGNVHDAIRREKETKGWRRSKKVALIEANNPAWVDLAAEWCEPPRY